MTPERLAEIRHVWQRHEGRHADIDELFDYIDQLRIYEERWKIVMDHLNGANPERTFWVIGTSPVSDCRPIDQQFISAIDALRTQNAPG